MPISDTETSSENLDESIMITKQNKLNESIATCFRNGFGDGDLMATPNECAQFTDKDLCSSPESVYQNTPLFCYESDDAESNLLSESIEHSDDYLSNSICLKNESRPLFQQSLNHLVAQTNSSSIEFHATSLKKFVCVMKHPAELFFHGQIMIRVLSGSVDILGYTLKNIAKKSTEVYSPLGFSKLKLKTSEGHTNCKPDKQKIRDTLVELGLNFKFTETISNLNDGDCVVLIERVDNALSSYLASHCSTYLYPKGSIVDATRPFIDAEKVLHCSFETNYDKELNHYYEPPEWANLIRSIIDNRHPVDFIRLVVCGGKSVGKSTLLRYMTNQFLDTTDEILCLDFDPGQSEFTMPGCVSVVKVNKPLLGPNFTHLLVPERMIYIGDVDISKCPDQYIKAVQHIIDFCLSQPKLKEMVWLINTMGFNKGLGVDIMADLIHMINPSHVIQIESQSAKQNYPSLLTSKTISQQKTKWRKVLSCDKAPSYSLLVLPSAVKEDQYISGMRSKTQRNIMVLAYFHQMLKPPRFALTDTLPYKVSFSKLKLGICHESVHYSQLLTVMNANLVALCEVSEKEPVLEPLNSNFPRVFVKPPIAPCLGFGVVRGVDMVEGHLYVLTTINEKLLKRVNCLLVGNVQLPACLYICSSGGLGHVPYVAKISHQATNEQIMRRFVKPGKRKHVNE